MNFPLAGMAFTFGLVVGSFLSRRLLRKIISLQTEIIVAQRMTIDQKDQTIRELKGITDAQQQLIKIRGEHIKILEDRCKSRIEPSAN